MLPCRLARRHNLGQAQLVLSGPDPPTPLSPGARTPPPGSRCVVPHPQISCKDKTRLAALRQNALHGVPPPAPPEANPHLYILLPGSVGKVKRRDCTVTSGHGDTSYRGWVGRAWRGLTPCCVWCSKTGAGGEKGTHEGYTTKGEVGRTKDR